LSVKRKEEEKTKVTIQSAAQTPLRIFSKFC